MEKLISLIDNVSDNETLLLLKDMVDLKMQEIMAIEVDKLILEGKTIIERYGLPNDYFLDIFQSVKNPVKLHQLDLLAHVNQANARAQEVRGNKKVNKNTPT